MQMCQALTVAHPRIIHRDIKPSNILVDLHGTAKLADLGLAKQGTGEFSTDPFPTGATTSGWQRGEVSQRPRSQPGAIMGNGEEKHEFKGTSLAMVASFVGVILLRYFEVITWPWYVVVPAAIATMVIVPAVVSTARFMKRGF